VFGAVTSYIVRELSQITRPKSIVCEYGAVKKAARRTLGLGVTAGIVYAAMRAYRARMPPPRTDGSWETAPFPFPPIPRPSSSSQARTNGADATVEQPDDND
jgi:hypothetical protein